MTQLAQNHGTIQGVYGDQICMLRPYVRESVCKEVGRGAIQNLWAFWVSFLWHITPASVVAPNCLGVLGTESFREKPKKRRSTHATPHHRTSFDGGWSYQGNSLLA